MELPTPLQIAEAWHGIVGRWFVRRNKARTLDQQWEVVCDDGGSLEVMGRYGSRMAAEARAGRLEDIARGEAVRRLMENSTI